MVQAATQGAAPTCFTNRTTRFGLVPGDMVKVVQENTGDKADYEPESRLERCFETGRHKGNHVTGSMLTP
jgi:hypothetical protein